MSRFDFACTTHGPSIVAKVLQDRTSKAFLATQDEQILKDASRALSEDPDLLRRLTGKNLLPDDMQKYIRPIFSAFAHLSDPTGEKKGSPWKYLDWICRSYLKNPCLTEDIYKIRDDLRDFEAFAPQLSKERREINKIPSHYELVSLLQPLQDARNQRKAEEARRRQSEEEREKILDETSIIYDGPEGKIVMPHTQHSCTYWGQQTKWCISATSHNAFQSYHQSAPFFIFLPKPSPEERAGFSYSSFKFAGTQDRLYDEHDRNPGHMPHCLFRLVEAAGQKMARKPRKEMLKFSGISRCKSLAPSSGIWESESDMLRAIKKDKRAFIYASKKLRSDREFALKAVWAESSGCDRGDLVPLLDDTLTSDPSFALAALIRPANKDGVRNTFNHSALPHFTPKALKDKKLVLALLRHTRDVNVDISFVWDPEFMREALPLKPDLLMEAPLEIYSNKSLVLLAVTADGTLLRRASEELRSDKEVVHAAIKRTGKAFEYIISPELKKDPDILLEAIPYIDSWTLKSVIPGNLRKDPSFMRRAMERNRDTLSLMDKDLWKDKSVVMVAIHCTSADNAADSIREHAPEMLNDRDVAQALSVKTPELFLRLPKHLKTDTVFILECAAHNPNILGFVSEDLRANKGLMLEAVKRNWNNLKYVADSLKEDRDVAITAISQSWKALEFSSRAVKANKEIALIAVHQSWEALKFVARDLRGDKEIIMLGLSQSKRALEYASGMLAYDGSLGRQGTLRRIWGKVARGTRNMAGTLTKPFRQKIAPTP